MRRHSMLAGAVALGAMTAAERSLGRYIRDPNGHPGAPVLTPEQAADQLRKTIDAKHDEVMKKSEAALAEAQKSGALSAETKASVDQMLTGMTVLREQLAQVEQKMARKPGSDPDAVKSYGAQVAGSDKMKSYREAGYQGSARIGLKAITTATAGTAWSERDPDVAQLPMRQLRIRDLLDVVPTSSASIDYAAQTLRANAAAPVAEAALKPYSNYGWTATNVPVRTIAHLTKITRQALDDAIQLQGEVEAEMRYGLAITEEAQELFGDGTGQNLNGLVPGATAYAAPVAVANATHIDVLRLALLQVELALYPTDGIILNPADWAGIELTKDAQGRYIWANPMNLGGPRLWSKPVVSTVAMTSTKFLVGAFKLQTLYDRMSPEIVISSENADDFERNLLTMRCEERLALAIKRPLALVTGTFA